MELITYERPREKLRIRGASSLSTAELLQVIIGSGTVHMSAAKMAREVHALLRSTEFEPTYDTMRLITGLGDATACRIMAALQLARRFSGTVQTPPVDTHRLSKAKRRSILYITYDGSNCQLGSYYHEIAVNEAALLIAKRVCSTALANKANGIFVAYGYAHQSPQLTLFEQSLVNDLKELTGLLQLRLHAIEGVSKNGQWVAYQGRRK